MNAMHLLKPGYSMEGYLTKKRWCSYWHQINEIVQIEPESILEIGGGIGVFKTLLEYWGYHVYTVDINPELKPDCVASVLDMPLKDHSYDVCVAFQVLEHLPWSEFSGAVSELRRVAKKIRHYLITM
jgi:ubiquinone/menaquinone biosynthesis C-methylase UbiE